MELKIRAIEDEAHFSGNRGLLLTGMPECLTLQRSGFYGFLGKVEL